MQTSGYIFFALYKFRPNIISLTVAQKVTWFLLAHITND